MRDTGSEKFPPTARAKAMETAMSLLRDKEQRGKQLVWPADFYELSAAYVALDLIANAHARAVEEQRAITARVQIKLFDIEELLGRLLEYFEDREDVLDGPEGRPMPNEAMNFASDIRRALDRKSEGPVATEEQGLASARGNT